MHVAADRPEKIFAAPEHVVFVAVENAAIDQFLWLAHPIDILGDPEQRVQIAQSALAFFDVRLDQIPRLSDTPVAFLALGKLGGDEFRRGTLHHFLVETGGQVVIEFCIAVQKPRFEQCRADRHVRLGLADAFVDRPCRVADFLSHVPEAIEQRLGDRFTPGGLFVRQ